MTEPVPLGKSELEARLASFVTDHRLPGAAAGVVCDGELAWSSGAGFADLAAGRRTEPDGLYRIASITKTFTGTAIMALRDAGRLDLDDPAVRYLPELRQSPSPAAAVEAVTIRRMLSHESGLASEPPGTDWTAPAFEGRAEQTLRRAAEIVVALPPNRQQKYSNLAYQLLGEIVARVTGTPYPEHLRETILDPLGLAATGFEPLPGDLPARRATGYRGRAFSDRLEPAEFGVSVWAEGGLWSAVPDLAAWLRFQLGAYSGACSGGNAGPGPASPVLAAASLREMHQPRYLGDDEWTQAWGVSWYAIRKDEVTWVQHSGSVPGFTANVCFDPRTRVGAIALVNGSADPAVLAMELAATARAAVRAVAAGIEAPVPVPDGYAPLLGLYAAPDLDLILRLEWRDGKLAFLDQGNGGPPVCLAQAGDADTFVAEPGVRASGEQVVFRRLADGRVASAFVAGGTMLRLDPVTPPG
jgi:CubicO group peptidase (beta-lactamase class C family)